MDDIILQKEAKIIPKKSAGRAEEMEFDMEKDKKRMKLTRGDKNEAGVEYKEKKPIGKGDCEQGNQRSWEIEDRG
ncbi:hypothetical protein L2E82_51164 [Cichorium intybus]|nr:hypothetical protein L2E82_51164 [Cichorium intybus]